MSELILRELVFDKIEFIRKGFKNNNKLQLNLQVQIGINEKNGYKVTLILNGEKEKEYTLNIILTGYFDVENKEGVDNKGEQDLINKNAVAILMPYLRSEVTLLTSQPGIDSIVLPPFNVNRMLSKE